MTLSRINRLMDRASKALMAVFIVLFVYESLAVGIGARARLFADAQLYFDISQEFSFWSIDFWSAGRPAGVPLVYKLVGGSADGLIAVQVMVHLFCWAAFAVYLFCRLRTRLVGLLLGAAVLTMAVRPDIVIWNYCGLSESLTFSLLPIIAIFHIELATKSRLAALCSLVGVLGYFSILRDSNAYFTLAMAPVMGLLFLAKKLSFKHSIWSVALVVAWFGLSQVSSDHAGKPPTGGRWYGPLLNVISHRVLVDENMIADMQKRGMPVNDALVRKRDVWGRHKDSSGYSFYNDPDLADFRVWVSESGKRVYVAYLAGHPGYAAGEVWSNRRTVFHVADAIGLAYTEDGVSVDNIAPFSRVTNRWFYLALTAMCGLTLIAILPKRNQVNGWCVLSFLVPVAAAFLLALITYHGDAMEVSRHTLIVPEVLKVSLFAAAFYLYSEYERTETVG